MLEKDLYHKFKKLWQPNYSNRIEPKYSGGIPDLLIVSLKTLKAVFLELKVIEYSKKHFKVLIRPSQIIWMSQYPGIAYVLIGMNSEEELKYCLMDKKYAAQLVQGMDWKEVKENGIFTSDLIDIINFLKNN